MKSKVDFPIIDKRNNNKAARVCQLERKSNIHIGMTKKLLAATLEYNTEIYIGRYIRRHVHNIYQESREEKESA